MPSLLAVRPDDTEFSSFYASYVAAVPDGDLFQALDRTHEDTVRWLREVPAEREEFRYAEGKWSVKEVIGHLADAERVFAHRMLRFARADATPLPPFDENLYVDAARFERRTLASLLDEWAAVRQATLSLVRTLDDTELARSGTASGASVTVRGLAWIIAGHELHHVNILRERYAL